MFRMLDFLKITVAVTLVSLVVVGCSEQPGSSNNQQSVSTDVLSQQSQAAVDRITEAYLSIQSQLASDSIAQVPAQLQAISESAQSLEATHQNTALNTHGAAIAKAADIDVTNVKAARQKLVDLSASVIELVQAHPPSDAAANELYLAQCPMVEHGFWLQTSREITNPYMESRMLQCGSIEQAIKGSDEAIDGPRS